MSQFIDSLSNDEIVLICHNKKVINRGDSDVRCLAKLSDAVIVKYGSSITAEEAANQAFAYKDSRTCDLRVLEIYRYFRVHDIGYIVMEFVHGVSLEDVPFHEDVEHVQRLAKSFNNLVQQIPVDFPGPRNGGVPRGYLFSEDGAGTELDLIPKLNQWLNERFMLQEDESGFDFDLLECKFCHLDLTRRNKIMCPDGSFCLLDWEHAGIYPAVFETYCLLYVGQREKRENEFLQRLLDALETCSPKVDNIDRQNRHVEMLDRVYRNNMRYCL